MGFAKCEIPKHTHFISMPVVNKDATGVLTCIIKEKLEVLLLQTSLRPTVCL